MSEKHFSYVSEPCKVLLCNFMGNDTTAVDAARISFRNQNLDPARELNEKDVKLLKYLIKNEHTSPFRHTHFTFYIKAPEFVMRQLYKHVVGIEVTTSSAHKDHAWSEVSGRYKEMNEVYIPPKWHTQHKSSKQCSGEPIESSKQISADSLFTGALSTMGKTYFGLLELGVSKEEARMILPMNFMTEVIWTCSLQAVLHFIKLRRDPHAQYEIRVLAEKLLEHVQSCTPIAVKHWFE